MPSFFARCLARCLKHAKRRIWRDQCLTWDWSEEILAIKLDRLAHVIAQVNGERGPDPAEALAGKPGVSDHWPLTVTLAERKAGLQ